MMLRYSDVVSKKQDEYILLGLKEDQENDYYKLKTDSQEEDHPKQRCAFRTVTQPMVAQHKRSEHVQYIP